MAKNKGRWFRFYGMAAHDAKVQTLPGELFKTWVNLMSLACLLDSKNGELPSIDEIAFGLRLRIDEAKKRLDALVKARLIDRDGDALKLHNWEHRQYESDVSTSRVKAFRERSKGNDETLHNGSTKRFPSDSVSGSVFVSDTTSSDLGRNTSLVDSTKGLN